MAGSSISLFAVCCIATLLFHAQHGMAYDRSLLAEQVVSKCNWVRGSECSVNPVAVLSVPATDGASNLARKFAAAHATCPTYSTQEQCNKPTAAGVHCLWDSATSKCTTDDVDTRFLFACPGSKAAKVLPCFVAEATGDSQASMCPSSCVAVNYTEPTSETKNTGRHLLSPSNQAGASDAGTPTFTSSRSMAATRDGGTMTYCMPSDMADAASLKGYLEENFDPETNTYNTAWWGSCESVTLTNKFTGRARCQDYNTSDACQGAHTCQWSATSGPSSSGTCQDREDSDLVFLADSSSGTFVSTVQAMYTACHNATSETTCTNVGTAKYDDTTVASALAYTSKTSGAWVTAVSTLQIMLAALAAMMLAVAV